MKTPSEHLPTQDPYAPIKWDDLLQPVDYSQNLLGNRLLERGQGFLIFGPAGCGKSVAAAQALAEWAAGLDGLHIPPPRPLRIVVLQTEDSINDHRENFNGILDSSVFTPEACSLIRQNLIILPQAPGGGANALAGHLNTIGERYKPDLVCVNPLLAFVSGDPTRELGGLLYQTIDPIIKRWGFGFLGIHHTPKTNNRDTSNYGAHDWQYAAAGDARVANWPRAMISIEPVANGVYLFRAAKRWNRTGWTWDLKPTSERYFKWAQNCVRWVDAMPEEVQIAEATEDYRKLLEVLPGPTAEGISRDRMHVAAKSKLSIGKGKADSWLKLCLEDGIADRSEHVTESKRTEALFRRKAEST